MRRYPHKAVIVIDNGMVVNGEWQEDTRTVEIIGRYDPANNENLVISNSHGDEKRAKAEFYTSTRKIANAGRLVISELGIDEPIIAWWNFQQHSVIYV